MGGGSPQGRHSLEGGSPPLHPQVGGTPDALPSRWWLGVELFPPAPLLSNGHRARGSGQSLGANSAPLPPRCIAAGPLGEAPNADPPWPFQVGIIQRPRPSARPSHPLVHESNLAAVLETDTLGGDGEKVSGRRMRPPQLLGSELSGGLGCRDIWHAKRSPREKLSFSLYCPGLRFGGSVVATLVLHSSSTQAPTMASLDQPPGAYTRGRAPGWEGPHS